MTERLQSLLRCPISFGELELNAATSSIKQYGDQQVKTVTEGILLSANGWMYPVIDGIPRMSPDAFLEYEKFLQARLPDYPRQKQQLLSTHADLLETIRKLNNRTKQSFEQEWKGFDHNTDRTWNQHRQGILDRFFLETGHTSSSISQQLLLDAGCGNGLLDLYLAEFGAEVVAMDFTRSVEKPSAINTSPNAMFVQGDVAFPPFVPGTFDIIQCSGVLVHVARPVEVFQKLTQFLQPGGLMSVWVYHRQADRIHRLMVWMRRPVSHAPGFLRNAIIKGALLPLSYMIKRLKGNRQTVREMKTDLLDHFTPEYRWEFETAMVRDWFINEGYTETAVTTSDRFGFNTAGIKTDSQHRIHPLQTIAGNQG